MEKIKMSTVINAPKEKVWEMLWNLDAYRTWTTAFTEGSDVQTDNWKEGSKVLFLDPNGSGMVSTVAAHRPNEFMSFQHQGEVHNGIEDTGSEKVKAWAGAKENYILEGENGKATLTVEMDVTDDFRDYMLKTWPLALEKVKGLCEGSLRPVITITAEINAPVEKVWSRWTGPEHIKNWNFASDDWHCPATINDLKAGGKFSFTMASRDGKYSFDFEGVYSEVKELHKISYTIADGRKVDILFSEKDGKSFVKESFEAENMHSLEMQRGGWQSILDNFKKYTEAN